MALNSSGFYEINLATLGGKQMEASTTGYTAPLYVAQLPGAYPLPGYVAPVQQPAPPAAPAEPVSAPTYKKATASFGAIRHVEPVRDHFVNARINIEALRGLASNVPTGKSLLERVEDFLEKHQADYDYKSLINGLGVKILPKGDASLAALPDPASKLRARFFGTALPKVGDKLTVNTDATTPGEVTPIQIVHNTHSALFATGTVMTDDIRTMEALRHALVKLRRKHQEDLEKEQVRLRELEARIDKERATLKGLEARRSEMLDDYAVAQRLLAEHWQAVEQQWAERRRIIQGNVGLYYVRVRETPLSRRLPDPLDLRPGNASDLVPGCPGLPTALTAELHPFMETVLDIPAADWAALSKLATCLPGRGPLEQMVQKRRQRITLKQNTPARTGTTHPTLNALLFHHQAMVQEIAARPFTVTALREMQRQGHRILALEDLLISPIPALYTPANQLHQRLTAAADCLLQRLRAIRPSIRLAWADLADDNRLAVENPERWPHLEQAETDDFNNLRTLVELIGWWFRQLDSDASGDSRTALRNLVRACLLLSASDDPQQLLQGGLRTLPTRFRPGELLRLDLNREPSPGNLLQLLDDRQQVVATVRVEDHDDKGTLASIVAVLAPQTSLTLAMRVTGQRT